MGWGQNPLDGSAVPTADPLSAPRSLWDKRVALVLGGALHFVAAQAQSGAVGSCWLRGPRPGPPQPCCGRSGVF